MVRFLNAWRRSTSKFQFPPYESCKALKKSRAQRGRLSPDSEAYVGIWTSTCSKAFQHIMR